MRTILFGGLVAGNCWYEKEWCWIDSYKALDGRTFCSTFRGRWRFEEWTPEESYRATHRSPAVMRRFGG